MSRCYLSPMRQGNVFFMVCFALFWSAITLTFDGFIFGSMFKQLQALNYATTTGRVVSSEVTRRQEKG